MEQDQRIVVNKPFVSPAVTANEWRELNPDAVKKATLLTIWGVGTAGAIVYFGDDTDTGAGTVGTAARQASTFP